MSTNFPQARLTRSLDRYRDSTGTAGRKAIVEELRRGHRSGTNPKTVARRISKRVEKVAVTRAMTIARTEMMVATWGKTALDYSRDPTVTGWQWQATRDPRTCVICIAMHGTTHPKTERLQSHPNCRCAMLPIHDPNALPIPASATGEAFFRSLTPGQQRKALGNGRYAAYRRTGRLSDLIGASIHPLYGVQRAMIPTRSLTAAAKGGATGSPGPLAVYSHDAVHQYLQSRGINLGESAVYGPRLGLDKIPIENLARVITMVDDLLNRYPMLAGGKGFLGLRAAPPGTGNIGARDFATHQADAIGLNLNHFGTVEGWQRMEAILARQAQTGWSHGSDVRSGVIQHEFGHAMDSWIRFSKNSPISAYTEPGSPAYRRWEEYESWRTRRTVAPTRYGKGNPDERIAEMVTRAMDGATLTKWELEGVRWFREAGIDLNPGKYA